MYAILKRSSSNLPLFPSFSLCQSYPTPFANPLPLSSTLHTPLIFLCFPLSPAIHNLTIPSHFLLSSTIPISPLLFTPSPHSPSSTFYHPPSPSPSTLYSSQKGKTSPNLSSPLPFPSPSHSLPSPSPSYQYFTLFCFTLLYSTLS